MSRMLRCKVIKGNFKNKLIYVIDGRFSMWCGLRGGNLDEVAYLVITLMNMRHSKFKKGGSLHQTVISNKIGSESSQLKDM